MLREILTKKTTVTNLNAESKDDLLIKMVELINKSGKISNPEIALEEIRRRERIMSTGIGKGIALPHAKTDAVDSPAIAVATLAEPIDFQALDEEKVDIVFMLLGTKTNIADHLKALSEISHYLNDEGFKEKIKQCQNPEDVIKLFDK